MNSYVESHFAEKSGIVESMTQWGRWWQTLNEIHMEINVKEGTKSNEIQINNSPSFISVKIRDEQIVEGTLYGIVKSEEMLWTLEDRRLVHILLEKVKLLSTDTIWKGLLRDQYMADTCTIEEMKKKIDLEKYQMENPGFDFSSAKINKSYDET